MFSIAGTSTKTKEGRNPVFTLGSKKLEKQSNKQDQRDQTCISSIFDKRFLIQIKSKLVNIITSGLRRPL
jgi:hypothetical protein